MQDFGRLVLRLAAGGLLAGHGAQKLFGSFGGYGLKGTASWLESIGHKPGHPWAMLAGLSEFGGGALTVLGLGGPIGPIATLGSMGMATTTLHWGKPIWATSGGAELPVVNMAVASALALAGPGRFSLDHALGVRVPGWLTTLALAGTLGGIVIGLATRQPPATQERPEEPADEARTELDVPAEKPVAIDDDQDLPRAA